MSLKIFPSWYSMTYVGKRLWLHKHITICVNIKILCYTLFSKAIKKTLLRLDFIFLNFFRLEKIFQYI